MMSLKFTLMYGSYLTNRTGIRIVHYLDNELKKLGHQTNIIDAKALNLPMIEKRYVDYAAGQAPDVLEKLKNIYENETDAFIVVAGEYNGSIQPGLKNLLDHFQKEYFHRPSGIVSYSTGPLGGSRNSGQLRTLLGILGMPAIPNILIFPEITKQLDEAGNLINTAMEKPALEFIKELSKYSHALKNSDK